MANLSSEAETDALPERPTGIQPYQFEPVRLYSMGFAKSHSLKCSRQMGMMWCSKKVSSFELYKFNPLSPHCRSIAQELMHCYTRGCL